MKNKLFLISFLLISGFLATNVKAVMAGPHLSFSPASGTYSVGEEFSVTVKMDSGSQVIGGADGVGTYDASILELLSIVKSPSLVFSNTDDGGSCNVVESESGKFSFSCYSNSNSSSNSDSGDLVTFNFKGKAVGTGLAKFNCTQGSTTDSNITKTNPVGDIITCSENVNGSYVIKAGSGVVTPTSTTVETTSNELPKTGAVGATLGLILFGAISVVSAVFLKFL